MATTGGETLMVGVRTSIQEMSIVCPRGWRDTSTLILTAERPGTSGITPNLVITRRILPDDLPSDPVLRLQEFVNRQILAMQMSLDDFVEITCRHPVKERLTASLRISCKAEGMPVIQLFNYAYSDHAAVVISAATAGKDDFPDFEQTFASMLRSVRLGERVKSS